MLLTIDVAGDDFLNRVYKDIYNCPMCVATRRVVKETVRLSMGGIAVYLNGTRYPFLLINGQPYGAGNRSNIAVRAQRPFTFTVDIPAELVKAEYQPVSERIHA